LSQLYKPYMTLIYGTCLKCLEQLRSSKRTRDRKNDAELMYSEQIFHPDDVNTESNLQIMEGCISTLNDLQKECIDLFYYQKQSYKDIADKLSLNYTKVRSAIQNGRRNISRCMSLKKAVHHER